MEVKFSSKADKYKMTGKYNEAINKYILEAEDSNSTKALNSAAFCYRMVGDYNSMLSCLKESVDQNDNHAMLYMASYYREINNYEEMLRYYLMAGKTNSYGYYELALYYNDKGDIDNAIKYHMMAIEKHNFKSMYEIAMIYETKKNYMKAYEYYSMIINNYTKTKQKKNPFDSFAKYSSKAIMRIINMFNV